MKSKRPADKKHSREWWGTEVNIMCEVGKLLQSGSVKRITITPEQKRPKGSLAELMPFRLEVWR